MGLDEMERSVRRSENSMRLKSKFYLKRENENA